MLQVSDIYPNMILLMLDIFHHINLNTFKYKYFITDLIYFFFKFKKKKFLILINYRIILVKKLSFCYPGFSFILRKFYLFC